VAEDGDLVGMDPVGRSEDVDTAVESPRPGSQRSPLASRRAGEVRDVVIGVDSRGALVAGTLVAGDLVTGGLAIGRQFLAAVRREAVAPVDDAVDAPDVTAGAVRRGV